MAIDVRFGRKNKYGAKKTPFAAYFGNRVYDSKREAAYAAELEMRRRAGDVLWWLPQVPIPLPGDVVYRVDFLVAERSQAPLMEAGDACAAVLKHSLECVIHDDDRAAAIRSWDAALKAPAFGGFRLRWIDVKGKDTPVSKLKRKQVREIHKIEVEVVR